MTDLPSVTPDTDEGALDPEVAEWMAANPMFVTPLETLTPEVLALARMTAPPTLAAGLADVSDDEIAGVPVRMYRQEAPPTGVVVYFHGGGYCLGSVGLMDNVAKAIARHSGAHVVSVEYRLAPEHPFPAGLDDCDAVTTWVLAHADAFDATATRVAVAGESAGGNLSATVSLRRRDAGGPVPCTQVLIYPGTAGTEHFPSRDEFDGVVLNRAAAEAFRAAYSAGRDIWSDGYAAPLHATSLAGLPPALVILAGSDLLRDEGRAYARRLAEEGTDVEEVCFAGQPHGFVNFDLPAAAMAHETIGAWLRLRFGATAG
ncbi:MAG: alpha/beta hydrolase [Actinobacteria bacterium]|nr:alpha/beta hydrolase [Actinomycetota bacterium]